MCENYFIIFVSGESFHKKYFWPMVCPFNQTLSQKTKQTGTNLPLGFLEFEFSHSLGRKHQYACQEDPVPLYDVKQLYENRQLGCREMAESATRGYLSCLSTVKFNNSLRVRWLSKNGKLQLQTKRKLKCPGLLYGS